MGCSDITSRPHTIKKSLFLLGFLLVAVPAVTHAEPAPLFERIFDEARQALPGVRPSGEMKDYIIKEMERWDTGGIQLTEEDLWYAIIGEDRLLCLNKKNMAGVSLEFAMGGDTSVGGSCLGLRRSILSLLSAEQEAAQLGADLVAIANGSELSVADEGSRPVNMGRLALLLRRVWSGVGGGVLAWEEDANEELAAVDSALAETDDINRTVMRFRHGYFRDRREGDQTFTGIGDDVGVALQALADELDISGDETFVGEFTVPGLASASGAAVWARKDDIGLLWVYPTQFTFPKVKPGGTYPTIVPGGDTLAHPFSYDGPTPDASRASPLCSRTVARNGYLCRPLPPDATDCDVPPDPNKISLVKCGDDDVVTSTNGPLICEGLQNLYTDDGTPFAAPANPGSLNPDLKPADVNKICEPGTKVLYQDEITAHACYIGHCLLQSMNGHTLVPNRNPTLAYEATSPYLACVRPDPQLGLYTEVAQEAPYPLPPYIGHLLVQDFEQEYCLQSGKPASPVLGFCSYREDARTRTPDVNQFFHFKNILAEAEEVTLRHKAFLSLATVIGQRAAGEQAHEVERKVFASLAALVQQIADLFLELKRAPLTQSACPWTGPFLPAP